MTPAIFTQPRALPGFASSTFRYLLAFLLSLPVLSAGANDVTARATGDWNTAATWVRTLSGLVSVTSGSKAVAGTGTLFLTQVSAGDVLRLPDGSLIGTVQAVNSNTSITLVANSADSRSAVAWGKQAVPQSDDAVFIGNAYTVTLNTNASIASLTLTGPENNNKMTQLSISNFTLTVTGKVQIDAGSGNNRDSRILFTHLAGGLDVGGDLIVGSAGSNASFATLDCGGLAVDIKVKGSFTRYNSNGTFYPGTASKVWFTGSSAQTIDVTNLTYAHIRTSNTAGVTLGGAVSSSIITGNIDVLSGTLSTNNHAVALASGRSITVSSGATLDGGSSVITLSGAGAATIAGTFKTSNPSGLIGGASTAFAGTPSLTITGSTIEYKGSGQVVTLAGLSYNHLVFSGGSKTVGTATGQTLTIGGNWTVNSASNLLTHNPLVNVGGNVSGTGALSVGNSLITVAGDWTHDGGFTAGANMKFTSASATNIPAGTYTSLQANGPKTISGNVTTTTLSLTGNARFSIGNNNLVVTTLGATTGNYIVTDGSGSLRLKTVAAGSPRRFPVGVSATSYTPVVLTPTTVQDWSVRVQAGFSGHGTVNAAGALPRMWEITAGAGSTTTSTDVQFQYDEADLGWSSEQLEIYHYGTLGGWQLAQGNTAPGGTVGGIRTITLVGQTAFSPFAISKVGNPLPVNFLEFSGKRASGRNQLAWATAQEADNRGFSIERSTDGRTYKSVGFVESLAPNGNSSRTLRYSFVDNSLEGRVTYFYRLQQQDRTGHSRYSTVIRLKPDAVLALQIQGLYPNPAQQELKVSIESPSELRGRYTVVNAAGMVVKEGAVSLGTGANTLPIGVSGLPAGQYLFRLSDGAGGAWTGRFIKN